MGHQEPLINLSEGKNGKGGRKKNFHFPPPAVPEKKERGERGSSFSLRSTNIGLSVFFGPRTNVNHIDEGYAWIPESPGFAKVSRGRFGKSKASSSESVSRNILERLLTLQEVGNLPTQVYFQSRSRFGLG